MKTPTKPWPNNVVIFRIGRWRTDCLDQGMMRAMRRISDECGSTIEEVMDRALFDFVQSCVADGELARKIIPFSTKRLPNPNPWSDNGEGGHLLHRSITAGDPRPNSNCCFTAKLKAATAN